MVHSEAIIDGVIVVLRRLSKTLNLAVSNLQKRQFPATVLSYRFTHELKIYKPRTQLDVRKYFFQLGLLMNGICLSGKPTQQYPVPTCQF